MKKKEFIIKVKNTILNRVRFHAPICYDDNIDKRTLFDAGIDINLPIFKYDKVLTKPILKAFILAQKEEKFNLVLTKDNLDKFKNLSNLSNLIIYDKTTTSKSVLEMINKLNINYFSSSNYNLSYKDKFFKVQGEILNPHYDEFCLKDVSVFDDIYTQYNEFELNGVNFYVKVQNKGNVEKKVVLELNIPLNKGYYLFKRNTKNILIENLFTKEKKFLNFICRNKQFSFSNVDGLENSVFSCINCKITLLLKPQDESFVFFNFGTQKFSFKGENDIKAFMSYSRIKCCEIFNVQVKSKNPKFDFFFNKTLPQKIWINWLNGEKDVDLEKKYVSLKHLFVKGDNNFSLVNFKELGLKELGIFNGEYYKRILIIQSNEKFLRIGKTFFYNINGLSKNTLKNREPITVCFGS